MAFYDLSPAERRQLADQVGEFIANDLRLCKTQNIAIYFSDEDTYIRKTAYQCMGRLYLNVPGLRPQILNTLFELLISGNFSVRQTVINAAGEIGKSDFEIVRSVFDAGLFDDHHSPRNAVIGSIKKMGEVNPVPVLQWAEKYLHHPDKEIRREICHGIELRGRKHPEDILPLLAQLQHDDTARVRNTLVHVLGQIAYKTGCLEIVVKALQSWDNRSLVADALEEIIDVHHRYRNFAARTQEDARRYIESNFW